MESFECSKEIERCFLSYHECGTKFLFTFSTRLRINIADPSSMQYTCHMNFIIDLANGRVSVTQR